MGSDRMILVVRSAKRVSNHEA
ncbi:MAG: hypothetical protein QOC84_599, partial [Bradyrhizobium sp.]|nr:hypothetical protein [Bradyrhizobium sp.]